MLDNRSAPHLLNPVQRKEIGKMGHNGTQWDTILGHKTGLPVPSGPTSFPFTRVGWIRVNALEEPQCKRTENPQVQPATAAWSAPMTGRPWSVIPASRPGASLVRLQHPRKCTKVDRSRQKWTHFGTCPLCIAPQIGHSHFRSTNRFRRDCPASWPERTTAAFPDAWERPCFRNLANIPPSGTIYDSFNPAPGGVQQSLASAGGPAPSRFSLRDQGA